MLACFVVLGYNHFMKLPRRRFKGETTEIDVLRFDADMEQQSYRQLISEVQEEVAYNEYLDFFREIIHKDVVDQCVT